jgi:1,4-dihydroxy-2-naphthoate polyprenyltransferase
VYTALMAVPFLLVPPIAAFGRIGAVAGLVGIPFARKPVLAILEGARGPALIPVLGATGRVQLVAGAAMALGLWLTA